ncbi:ankyrin [Hypoxylon sp. NC1633]|nr:ankyrin [Hypoxylon sp. NC1633]
MNSGSPTTSTSTNRGGRPKDWTEPRARRLIRLYIYTRLPFELILKLLEDGVWKPGKDAANKVKNSLLGNDPRWIRPKDEEDEKRRIKGLRNSRRAAKSQQRTSTSHPAGDFSNIHSSVYHDDEGLTLAHSRHPSFETSNAAVVPKQETIDPTIEGGADIFTSSYEDHESHRFYSSWFSNMNTSRQGTGLTNSTDTSMTSSFREKLTNVSRDQAKGAWRVLKQFTFPKDPDLQRGTSFSPVVSPQSYHQPTYNRGSRNLDGSDTHDPSNAKYAVPGDFLNADLPARRGLCEIGSGPHEAGTCWCRILDELSLNRNIWSMDWNHPNENLPSDFYQRVDAVGNTAFHRLAAADGNRFTFIRLISQALAHPGLPIRATNTAGQTFLHVLHQSWFDDESLLDQLLNILKNANFDILATDVYGRSFFHVLQNKKRDSARIPPQLFDWTLLRRRDAFGVRPMDSRTRHAERAIAQMSRRAGTTSSRSSGRADAPPTMIDIPSDRGDESRIRPQADLLRIVVDAVKVEGVNSTNPNPLTEDSRGRNALHCLAEVELDVERVQGPTHDNQRQKKRKFKEEDDESTPGTSRDRKRLEYLEGILSAKVDVNHYDSQGQTPLMAFIRYRPEESRPDKEDMERIIKMLYESRANLEYRNREGETALHVAARSGKKVALKELLKLGANPFVRDACGLSVLAAIDELWANTEADGALTARLEACRGVFTSLVKDEAQEPTVLQEWGIRSPGDETMR